MDIAPWNVRLTAADMISVILLACAGGQDLAMSQNVDELSAGGLKVQAHACGLLAALKPLRYAQMLEDRQVKTSRERPDAVLHCKLYVTGQGFGH